MTRGRVVPFVTKTVLGIALALVLTALGGQLMPLQQSKIPGVRENRTVISKDGSRIAVSILGSGPALILVDGAFCYRGNGPSPTLAPLLARHFTVYAYDRRGRGESSDAGSYAIDREVADLKAVLDLAGGRAFVFAMSSGSGLALRAAVDGLGVTRLALYEPPFVQSGAAARRAHEAADLRQLIASGDRSGAVTYFMTQVFGAPRVAIVAMRVVMPRVWKRNASVAHTLPYDLAILGDWSVLAHAASINIPTLVIGGEKSPPELRDAVRTVSRAIGTSEMKMLSGQSHNVSMNVLSPVLTDFFLRR